MNSINTELSPSLSPLADQALGLGLQHQQLQHQQQQQSQQQSPENGNSKSDSDAFPTSTIPCPHCHLGLSSVDEWKEHMDSAHPSLASLFGGGGHGRTENGFHGSSKLNEISGKLFLEHAQRSPGSVHDAMLFSPLKHLANTQHGLKRPHPSSRHNSCSPQPLPMTSPASSVHSSCSQMTGPPEFLARLNGGDEGGRSTSPSAATASSSMDGPHACVQCSASFPNRDLLEKHEMLHSPNSTVVSAIFIYSPPGELSIGPTIHSPLHGVSLST